MTTYKCAACEKEVEIEVPDTVNVVEVKLCEVCVGVAEEAVREEAHDKGYQEGWEACEAMMEDEEEADDS